MCRLSIIWWGNLLLTYVPNHDSLELINLSLNFLHFVWFHFICDISLKHIIETINKPCIDFLFYTYLAHELHYKSPKNHIAQLNRSFPWTKYSNTWEKLSINKHICSKLWWYGYLMLMRKKKCIISFLRIKWHFICKLESPSHKNA